MIVKSVSSKSQIMLFPDWIRQRTAELNICVIFLTRMPLPAPTTTIVKGDVSCALWAAPVVGSAVGAVGAAIYWLMCLLHVPNFPAAALAVATTVAATGALHEDGLADVAHRQRLSDVKLHDARQRGFRRLTSVEHQTDRRDRLPKVFGDVGMRRGGCRHADGDNEDAEHQKECLTRNSSA